VKKETKSKVETGMMVEMATVAVDPDFGGKGIATNLTNLLIENARKGGFKICYAECSGHYSMRALVKSGGQIENTFKYAEYEEGGGCCSKKTKPFEKNEAPHTAINLVVFRINQKKEFD
jgi:predicted GNAT family acetyltransferase